MNAMRGLQRWHIWLGWLIGVPLLLWTLSGLWMVARPIEEVRGTALRAEPRAVPAMTGLRLPNSLPRGMHGLELLPRVDRPVWVAHGEAAAAAFDARSGAMLPPVDARLARAIADAALRRPGEIASVRRFAADAAPIDLRQERPSWQVAYADGLHVYVDAGTGQVLAERSRQWRLFDLMWGLHIMDLRGREDTSHPILIGAAALSLVGVLMGIALLFRRRRPKKRP
jgi:hypothetical protein